MHCLSQPTGGICFFLWVLLLETGGGCENMTLHCLGSQWVSAKLVQQVCLFQGVPQSGGKKTVAPVIPSSTVGGSPIAFARGTNNSLTVTGVALGAVLNATKKNFVDRPGLFHKIRQDRLPEPISCSLPQLAQSPFWCGPAPSPQINHTDLWGLVSVLG